MKAERGVVASPSMYMMLLESDVWVIFDPFLGMK